MSPDCPTRPFCPHARTARGYELETNARILLATGCRKWTCPYCGPTRKARLIRRIVRAAPNRMLTLTCRHEDGPAEQLARMVKALPRLITYLRRDGPIEYVRMLEQCVDGYPHFHLLIRSGYLDHATIKEFWTKNTKAEIVDIRKAHGKSVAYVAKYINKARDKDGTFSRQRLSVSRAFWRDDPQETLVVTENTREHPKPYAEAHLQERAIERHYHGYYSLHMREPGDEWPPEFYLDAAACENREAYASSDQPPEGLSTAPSGGRSAPKRESFAIPASSTTFQEKSQ